MEKLSVRWWWVGLWAACQGPVNSNQAEEIAAKDPFVAKRFLQNNPQAWQAERSAYTSIGWRSAETGPMAHVGAKLPLSSREPFQVAVGQSENYALKVTPVGAAAASAELEKGRLVYRDMYQDTDVYVSTDTNFVEHFFMLKSAQSPREFVWKFELPAGLPEIRPNGDKLEFCDVSHKPRLVMPRPFAIDAAGKKFDVQAHYADGQVTLRFDAKDAKYPVLVDPWYELGIWNDVSVIPSDGWGVDSVAMVAYDSVRQKAVHFEGNGYTWEWNGTSATPAWSLVATSGPLARNFGVMAYDPVRQKTMLMGGNGGFWVGFTNDTWEWNGTTWTQVCSNGAACTNGMDKRAYSRATYDAQQQRIVIFGGADGSGAIFNDTWQWDGTQWSAQPVPFFHSTPPARYAGGLAYDSVRKKLVLFGGYNGSSALSDVWELDSTTAGTTGWGTACTTAPCNSTMPAARYNHAMVYDATRQRVVVAGGTAGANEIWHYSGTAWTLMTSAMPSRWEQLAWYDSGRAGGASTVLAFGRQLNLYYQEMYDWKTALTNITTSPAQPGGRFSHVLVEDAGRNEVLLFGGTQSTLFCWIGCTPLVGVDDTYIWKNNAWTLKAPASKPPARHRAAAAYHAGTGKLVMFGGSSNVSNIEVLRGDTCQWTGSTGSWSCSTLAGPSARVAPGMARDKNGVLLMGGCTSGNSANATTCTSGGAASDVWFWNGTSWSSKATGPSARFGHVMAYDENRQVTVLFGGSTGAGTLNQEIWEWDGGAWSQKCTASPCTDAGARPSARMFSNMGYDRKRKKIVLTGGCPSNNIYCQDYSTETWEWNGSVWTNYSDFSNGQRQEGGMAYDDSASRKGILSHGGYVNNGIFGQLLDRRTMSYYTRGLGCVAGSECDTGNCVDGVCCESSSCGTCQQCNGFWTNGYCAAITSAYDADSCTAASGSICDSAGACKYDQGHSCTTSSQCATGYCVDGFCCSSACTNSCDVCSVALGASANGTCSNAPAAYAGSPACPSGYACNGASPLCPSTCSSDSHCASGYYCASNGTCTARKAQGSACNTAAGADCLTNGCRSCAANGGNTNGSCIDGYCCSSDCSGSCDVCATTLGASANGTCSNAPSTYSGNATCANGYLCTGSSSACRSSCTLDTHCQTGYYCSSNACTPKLANGSTCSAAGQCASGNCADGKCCNSACGSACDVCSAALGAIADGTCSNAPSTYTGSPACGNYYCSGGAATCPTTCTSDGQCTSGNYCNGTNCVTKKAQGQTCTTNGQCQSGNCVDGYCCSSACNGACDVCSMALGASANGACTIKAIGATGTPSCTPYVCSGGATCPSTCSTDNNCATGFFCNGGACTAKLADGAVCSGDNQCSNAHCVGNICCNSACTGACQTCSATPGTCTTRSSGTQGSPTCAPYLCGGGTTCPSSCTMDAQCASGYYCNGSACVPLQSNGSVCSATNQCASGKCTDGRCCNADCNKGCDRCDVTGAEGTCTPVARGQAGASPSCAPYLCSGTSADCPSSCASDGDCASNAYCASTTCVLRKAPGLACAANKECANDHCVDGFCCDTACDGPCDVCAASLGASQNGTCSNASGAGTPSCSPYLCRGIGALCPTDCSSNAECVATSYCLNGHCAGKMPNSADCTSDLECNSGHCIDGVCCATACGNACDSCNVVKGACTPSPQGTQEASCGAYACNGTSVMCPNNCFADSDCANQHYCINGSCSKKLANGVACGSNSDCGSNQCVDGVCCNVSCNGDCYVCNKPGKVGECTQVDEGSDPRNRCLGSGACKAVCGMSGMCEFPGKSKACKASDCVGATKLNQGAACDGTGGCVDNGIVECAPFICANAACPVTCVDDTVCASGTCAGGKCGLHYQLGAACQLDGDCDSLHCVDGVCCGSTCSGKCERCDIPNAQNVVDGTCRTPVGKDPDNDCPGAGMCHGACKADKSCEFPTAATKCDSCKACNGSGACTEMPLSGDDDSCGLIECGGLSSECITYGSISKARCVQAGICADANNPMYCANSLNKPDGEPCSLGWCQNGLCVAKEMPDMAAPIAGESPEKKNCSYGDRGEASPALILTLALVLFLRRRRARI